MSTAAAQILKQFSQLSAPEKRDVSEAILREATKMGAQASRPRKSVADVAGKYRPLPDNGTSDHNRSFAEAIFQSKGQTNRA